MPAVMPAVSWSPASDGPTVSTLKSENETGSAPYLRLVARLLAEAWVKLPSIWASPLVISEFMVGAESTWPSRTTANCRHGGTVPLGQTSASEILLKASVPSPSKSSDTT